MSVRAESLGKRETGRERVPRYCDVSWVQVLQFCSEIHQQTPRIGRHCRVHDQCLQRAKRNCEPPRGLLGTAPVPPWYRRSQKLLVRRAVQVRVRLLLGVRYSAHPLQEHRRGVHVLQGSSPVCLRETHFQESHNVIHLSRVLHFTKLSASQHRNLRTVRTQERKVDALRPPPRSLASPPITDPSALACSSLNL